MDDVVKGPHGFSKEPEDRCRVCNHLYISHTGATCWGEYDIGAGKTIGCECTGFVELEKYDTPKDVS